MFYLNISHQKSLLKMIFQFQGRKKIVFFGGEVYHHFFFWGGGHSFVPLFFNVFFPAIPKQKAISSLQVTRVFFAAPDVWKPQTAFSCPDSSCFCRFWKNAVVGH